MVFWYSGLNKLTQLQIFFFSIKDTSKHVMEFKRAESWNKSLNSLTENNLREGIDPPYKNQLSFLSKWKVFLNFLPDTWAPTL